MDDSLMPGLVYEYTYEVTEEKTAANIFPDDPESASMPKVLATGFLVSLFEFACIKVIKPYLDWPAEMTVGTRIDISHLAPTPPGMIITVKSKLENVEGRKLSFSIEAFDEMDKISTGTHQRFIINSEAFNAGFANKLKA